MADWSLRWWRITRHSWLYATGAGLQHRWEVEHYFHMKSFA